MDYPYFAVDRKPRSRHKIRLLEKWYCTGILCTDESGCHSLNVLTPLSTKWTEDESKISNREKKMAVLLYGSNELAVVIL
jgi:hypothetical protein